MRSGDELEEEHSVYGQRSTDAETKSSKETTESRKGGCSTGCDTKDTADEESGVEARAATDDVGEDTPQRSARDETHVEGEGHPGRVLCVEEFVADLGQNDGDTLEPDVVDEPAVSAQGEELPLELAERSVKVSGGIVNEGRRAYSPCPCQSLLAAPC